ncbi:MAG: chromosome segregation protein SMC [Phycisphaerae bacterium]|nr:chromosome segregation protein SMC [Phycisphaerae bacterium]
MAGFLKRAVLQGFKSFADRTEFEFGAGITTVVGPNGCGKSNILDAVRWVLGEQSARSLRGDRMADVIFAGSRSRQPANFAEVQLVFDNNAGILRSDQTEVAVGRVLYRNGDSAYRLNGKACRLKDIRELLLDTGVGVDAYSVIEQGRVDLLLQASPLQRREIFEEAAGISRYKLRRVEAQRKLERTQNNLLRLKDIIEELERRLRSVRLAAGKARNFQQYDSRLRELRASFSLAEYHEHEQSRLREQQEADELSAALQEERARLAAEDATVGELGQALQTQDEKIQAADAELLELQTALSALGERIAQGRRRLEDLAVTRDRRRTQAADLAERLQSLQERVTAEQAAMQDLVVAEEQSTGRIAEMQARRVEAEKRTEQLRETLERERVAAFDAVRRASLLQNEQANLEQQQSRLAAQVERLTTRLREIEQEIEQLATRCTKLTQRAAELDQQAAELAEGLRQDEARIKTLEEEAAQLDQEIGAAKENRSAVMSRLALLEDMERRLEGVAQGTRAVLAWRDEGAESGTVVGLVADLLRIDDPRVATLQAVLSMFEDHVVVHDTAAFFEELSRHGELPGPVRVLALDRLLARPIATGYESTPGFVARASDWVACEPEFRPLAEHLLGRTIIVDTVERALRLAAESLAGYVFVTLDGWTVHGDGRLTHGAAATVAGLISRKAEIRQLGVELEEVETRLVTITRRRMEVDEASSDLQLRRQGTMQRIATVQREHAELRGELTRANDERRRLERERALTGGDLETQRRALDELTEQRRKLIDESEAVAEAQRTHETQVTALARELEEFEAALEQMGKEYTAALVEKGRAAEKRAAGEETLEELRARCETLQREEDQARREAEEAVREIDAAEQELRQAREQQAEQNTECERRQQEVLRLRDERQELRQRLEECGTRSREVQRRIEAGESVLHEKQVALRETEVRREGLVARVREDLGLDLEKKYATYEHSEQDWEAIKAEIEELRGKISRLGNVNLDAITELEELTPRYEHLMSQQADLVSAIERLEALIVELDAESRTRFSRTFEQVRDNFQEMFRKLFGGGKADIILEEPDDPLECGIEIIARPPGKEPQSISLLSGGEKTLTAVALLLAVFKSRPSPFAILDEVDAALDESNTERFNNVLQEFLSHSQFVVITHSKRTMASADVLYGITMEEPGVSKRVSVRFEDRVQAPYVA